MRKEKNPHQRKPADQVKRDEQQKKLWETDEKEFFEHDEEFIDGTYGGGLVKGTRRIETSEVRPDKGM